MSEPKTLAANQKRAEAFLVRFARATVPHFINGEGTLSVSGDTFDTLDPTTNAKQRTVACGRAADVAKAAQAAADAFRIWRDISGTKRRAIGHRTEIYCSDYQTVDPDLEPIRWDLKDPQRQTLWGAPARRSLFEEGSIFRDVSPAASKLKAISIVAP